ncbi:siphovirus Gp157 family protein [Candidatus Gracilibacteria bacterium]|nr:siphovirus Gp157 family protein [Candidatus Gracilibacteria bacterium]
MTQITTIEGIIPKIQTLSLTQMQLNAKIVERESELANLPDVIRLQSEILELKKSKREVELEETGLRDEGKKMLIDSGMKEFTTLDGTTVALQFTPGALVIGENAIVPPEYFREKTTVEVDKVGLKKAIGEGKEFDGISIVKESKLVIKQK